MIFENDGFDPSYLLDDEDLFSMSYEVCIYVETPPQYLKLYKTLEDYKRCNVTKIVVIGSEHSIEDKEQYNRLREIYGDVVVFIDRERDKGKVEELLQLCRNAKILLRWR